MFVKIKSIEILPDFKIKALFSSNVVKTYDFNNLIQNHRSFAPLQQQNLFLQTKKVILFSLIIVETVVMP